MIANVALSVVLILMCASVMSLTAYAFFTHNVTSPVNVMQSASYDIELKAAEATELDGVWTFTNDTDAEKLFAFSLSKTAGSTAKVGYCEIVVSTDYASEAPDLMHHYYTAPIGKFLENGAEIEVNTRYYNIKVDAGKTAQVRIIAQWGSSANPPCESYINPPYLPPQTLSEEPQAEEPLEEEAQQEQEQAPAEEEEILEDEEQPSEEQPSEEQSSEEQPSAEEELPAEEEPPAEQEQPSAEQAPAEELPAEEEQTATETIQE